MVVKRFIKSVIFPTLLLICACQNEYNIMRSYDTPGEAELNRFLSSQSMRTQYKQFSEFVNSRGSLAGVTPDQFLRQGTDWRDLDQSAFAMPPERNWSNIWPTILLLQNEIIPAIGPVEILSGFRTTKYNSLAGGAPGSRHLSFQAIDVIPVQFISRTALHNKLTKIWQKSERKYRMGLGLYSGHRFHIDTAGYRRW